MLVADFFVFVSFLRLVEVMTEGCYCEEELLGDTWAPYDLQKKAQWRDWQAKSNVAEWPSVVAANHLYSIMLLHPVIAL